MPSDGGSETDGQRRTGYRATEGQRPTVYKGRPIASQKQKDKDGRDAERRRVRDRRTKTDGIPSDGGSETDGVQRETDNKPGTEGQRRTGMPSDGGLETDGQRRTEYRATEGQRPTVYKGRPIASQKRKDKDGRDAERRRNILDSLGCTLPALLGQNPVGGSTSRAENFNHNTFCTHGSEMPNQDSKDTAKLSKNVLFTVEDTTVPEPKSPTPDLQADRRDLRLQVSRFVYNQPRFDEAYGLCEPGPPLTPWENLKRMARKSFRRKSAKMKCSPRSTYRSLVHWFPILDWLPKYEWRKNAVSDIATGITIGFLNTPQGVAYAILGMAPAVTGLYVSFFPLLVYIVMATSRQCSLGTDSITSMMTSKIVHQFALKPTGNLTNDSALLSRLGLPYTAVEWSQVQVGTAVALMVGIWQLAFGLLGAGGLVVYFSDQLVQGFTCGAAVHVFSSQLKSVFGVKGMQDHFGVLKTWINFFQVIKTTHIPTMITAFIAIIFLVLVKFGLNTSRRVMRVIRVPLPAELFVVIFGTLISAQVGLETNYGVSIIKHIPNGFPMPSTPTFAHMYNTTNPEDGFPTSLLSDTFAIAVVSLCLSITLALLFANQHGYAIDPNQ
ncbi:putative Pendrin, partial [Hypsibius exemplaris]